MACTGLQASCLQDESIACLMITCAAASAAAISAFLPIFRALLTSRASLEAVSLAPEACSCRCADADAPAQIAAFLIARRSGWTYIPSTAFLRSRCALADQRHEGSKRFAHPLRCGSWMEMCGQTALAPQSAALAPAEAHSVSAHHDSKAGYTCLDCLHARESQC